MSPVFVTAWALRSLRRGGRGLLTAALCVAFGVASFVALQLVAVSLRSAVLPDPRALLGGDLLVTRAGPVTSDQLERLGAVAGEISPMARAPSPLVRSATSGRLAFLNRAMAVDPARFPLAGEVRLAGGGDLRTALARPDTVVVTRDVAERLGVARGDPILLGGGAAPALRLEVTAIAVSAPDGRGSTAWYSLATARAAGGESYGRIDSIALGDLRPGAAAALASQGWSIRHPVPPRSDATGRVIDLMLRGGGLLGLLVGVAGVANSMRVLLARRQTELAVLSALGYGRADLLALMGAEALLLGAGASALGIILGVPAAGLLIDRLASTGLVFLVTLETPPAVLALAWLLGAVTTAAFALHAVIRAVSVPPAAVLRQAGGVSAKGGLASIVAVAPAAAVAFAAAVIAVGSPLWGGLAVVGGVAVFASATAVFAVALIIAARAPLPGLPQMIAFARRNLTRRLWSNAAALCALSIGLFAAALAGAGWWSAHERLSVEGAARDDRLYVVVAPERLEAARALVKGAEVSTGFNPVSPGRRDGRTTVLVSADTGQAEAVGRALPDALVFTAMDLARAGGSIHQGLFALAAAFAALAMAIGLVLLANAVSLALFDRRREHAVLKAVGWRGRRVLCAVAAEFALFGALGSAVALGGARLVVLAVQLAEPRAGLEAPARGMAALFVSGAVVTALVALVTAAPALSRRPIDVLREP